ncbi:hypothetical protein ACWCQL_30090 [Streptomyces sp. NPDC002073]
MFVEADLVHRLFGLIGYAVDPHVVDLADHPNLVPEIRISTPRLAPQRPAP